MAIWQFHLAFVPRKGFIVGSADSDYRGHPLSVFAATKASSWLSESFGEPRTVVDGWFSFGQDQGNRFDLVADDAGRMELSARVDARADYAAFLDAICELASLTDCLLFSLEEGSVIDTSPGALSEAIGQSRAASYARARTSMPMT